MSRCCDICGKGVMSGNKVSKSYNHTRRTWRPNLLKIKAQFGGTTRTLTFLSTKPALRHFVQILIVLVVPPN